MTRLSPALKPCALDNQASRSSPRPWQLTLLVACLLGCPGCAAGWELGRDHYHDARYADALYELRLAEPEYHELEPDERARYALYRGLAQLAVGDARNADGWLSLAKLAADQEPGVFSAEELGRLEAAWRSMGRMPGRGAHGPAWLAGR